MYTVDNGRVAWVDALRILACAMVVVSHCSDGFVAEFGADREAFLTGTLVGSLMRPSVPLFVMITGVLLLPLPDGCPMASFYRRRVGRIAWPLVAWSLLLSVMAYLYFTGSGSGSANPSVDLSAYTPDVLVGRLWSWVLNFNFDTTPLWYLYMLVGLYLVMPVVGSWLKHASKKDMLTFLGLWFATLFIPYIRLLAPAMGYAGNYGNYDIFGGCDWNVFSTFHYVSGFIGYIILAYYLKCYPLDWGMKKMSAVFIPMFFVGYSITAGGYIWLQSIYPGDYAYLEIVWLFTGINVSMMTVPVFVFMQRLPSGLWRPWVGRVASLTFGVYLCHFFFVMVFYDVFDVDGMPYLLRILGMAVSVSVTAGILTWVLSANRITRILVK